MTGNDEEMKQTMLGMLAEEIPVEMEKMSAAHDNKDWNELFNISHKMKTTLAFVGNEKMIAINKEVEHAARHQQNLNKIEEQVRELNTLGNHVLIEMKKIIE
jgi:HPt (histidine-containing phosphotransfer) domain-containing protein